MAKKTKAVVEAPAAEKAKPQFKLRTSPTLHALNRRHRQGKKPA